jgi:protein-L-isoaspartate(D-aspartate) O-methyltransferase
MTRARATRSDDRWLASPRELSDTESMSAPDDRVHRYALIDTIHARIGAVPPRIRDALLEVDRARFVREADRPRAWVDEPLPLDTPFGEHVATISAPHVYVLGFDALDLQRGDRLLELGSGSGYGAALAAHVVGPQGFVTTVETDPHLARLSAKNLAGMRNVTVVHDDGLGRPDLVAKHDRCWLTFSTTSMPAALLQALPDGAVLVAPVGSAATDQRFVRYVRRGPDIVEDDLGAVRFVPSRPRIDD